MKLVIGLGNPGDAYRTTRHNIGFRVIDAFAAKYRIDMSGHEKDAVTGKGRVAGNAAMLARPLTFMNLSGSAVQKLARSYTETLDELMVVYDDVDLPVGKLRLRESGSPGTHNGMRSIASVLGSDRFPRLRFGIRGTNYDGQQNLADYVLSNFGPDEEVDVERGIDRALEALLLFCRGDLRRAMNEFNREPVVKVTGE